MVAKPTVFSPGWGRSLIKMPWIRGLDRKKDWPQGLSRMPASWGFIRAFCR